MDYLWLKALHIIAVVVWVGGMLVVAVVRSSVPATGDALGDPSRAVFFSRIRRWDTRVTTPAMLLVWAIGLSLAVTGDWFGQPWLTVKIGLALILSALHGMLSGGLRKLAAGNEVKGPDTRHIAIGIIVTVSIIVVLVVIKPF